MTSDFFLLFTFAFLLLPFAFCLFTFAFFLLPFAFFLFPWLLLLYRSCHECTNEGLFSANLVGFGWRAVDCPRMDTDGHGCDLQKDGHGCFPSACGIRNVAMQAECPDVEVEWAGAAAEGSDVLAESSGKPHERVWNGTDCKSAPTEWTGAPTEGSDVLAESSGKPHERVWNGSDCKSAPTEWAGGPTEGSDVLAERSGKPHERVWNGSDCKSAPTEWAGVVVERSGKKCHERSKSWMTVDRRSVAQGQPESLSKKIRTTGSIKDRKQYF